MNTSKKPKSRKLSIYLIKKEYADFSSIIKSAADEIEVTMNGEPIGFLYIKPTSVQAPSWLSFFEGSAEKNKLAGLLNKTVSAVLLLKHKSRIFAVTFGYGRSLLQIGCWEERFGLLVVLNTVDRDKIRLVDRKNLDTMMTHTRSQASRECAIEEFGLNVQQVFLKALIGTPRDENFAGSIAGADALSIYYPASLQNLRNKCDQLLTAFKSHAYKREFPALNLMCELTDKQKIAELNEQMIRNIKSGPFDRLYLAIPDIVEWTSIAGFRFTPKEDALHCDIRMEDFLETARDREEISLDFLKRRKVFQIHVATESMEEKWSVFHCINCELEKNGKSYILTEGKWFEIQSSYVAQVNDRLRTIARSSQPLIPAHRDEKEDDYIHRIVHSDESRYCRMHRKLVRYGGGNSQIEFCDIFADDKKMIHIKRYGGSSVLSHFFAQGVNSAKVFLSDEEFRSKLNNLLPRSRRFVASHKPPARQYEVVFGIISESASALPMTLPFFSKITLMNAWNELSGLLGFRMSVLGISVTN